jgi:hypothetical protein
MSLFNSEQFGKDPRFWLGQIVDDSEWKENRPGGLYETPDEIPGWGYRYKVRIFGKHPETGLQDVELPWADILYPVTGGSGHASSFQTPNLRKNSFVFGIYLDGKDETQPCIFGCFGNNDQTNLLFTRPPVGFTPASGLYGEEVPAHSVPPAPGPPKENVGLGENPITEANNQEEKDGGQVETLPAKEKCVKSLDKTQIELKRFIQKIQETQRRSQNWSYWVNARGAELASGVFRTETIDIDIQRSAEFIAGELKEFLNGIREFISELIDSEVSNFYKFLFPEEEKELEKAHDGAIDLITCLFNKIIANLVKIIGDLLKSIVGKIVNAATCFVENVVSSILGQLLGLITGTLNAIFGPITSLIGGVIDFAGDILGFISQVLGFFLCDEQSLCPENTEWSSWGGASGSKTTLDFNNIFNKAKEISEKSKKVVDPNNFDFNLDFSSVFEDTCNIGPILCGPPTIDFTGGGGRGAKGNAIVNLSGNILGVDIITSGSGYSGPPTVNFVDACGKGKGASAEVEMEDDENNPGKKKVKRVKIKSPGFGYLSGFDGSRGGDGRVFANADQVVIKRDDGIFEVFNPDDPFEVFEGDEVSGPFATGFLGGVSGGPVTVGGTGGTPVTAGGTGGTPVTVGGTPVTVGGTGGTPITAGGTPVTAGGTLVTVGGTGGTPVTVGGTGGTPVSAGGLPVTVGGTGGTPVTSGVTGGLPVTAGGTGGLGGVAGGPGGLGDDLGDQLFAGGTGGEEINVGGDSAVAGDLVVTVGGSGGTQVVSGGSGGTPVTIGGIPLIAGGTGGTPIPNVTSGGLPVTIGGIGGLRVTAGGTRGTPVIIIRDIPLIAGGTGGTLIPNVTSGGLPVTAGGTGGTPVTSGGVPLIAGGTGGTLIPNVTSGGLPVTAGGTGGLRVTAGGTGGTPVTSGGVPLIAGGTGGTLIPNVTSGGLPVTAGGTRGTPVTSGGTGGTPVTSGGTGGTPVTSGGIPLIAGGTGGTPIPNVTSGGLPVTAGGTGGTPVTSGGTGGTPVTIARGASTITDSTSFGSYPVVLKLCAVEIESTGVNYSPNDTISVIPSNGAVLEPVFGPFGSIIDINIIDEGEGFTQRPEIVINTESGYNAELIPILCVDRIGDVPEELYKIPQGEKIIKVIDCVGKP